MEKLIKMENREALVSRRVTNWFRGVAVIMVIVSHYSEWWSWFQLEEGIREVFRYGLSKMGPYGVGIFFLFSGYGLAKSAGKGRINFSFVLKRIISVYIPYLIIVLLIELLSDGFHSKEDFLRIFYGQDFWYMTVLFLLYGGFMLIWFLFKNSELRMIALCIFTYVCNDFLYKNGKQDFWFISNWCFPIGALLAVYEIQSKNIVDKLGKFILPMLSVLVMGIIYFGLFSNYVWETVEQENLARVWAVILFTIFVAVLSAVWKKCDIILPVIGKYSLYFYLTHTFLFMTIINSLEAPLKEQYVVVILVTMIVSIFLGKMIESLIKAIHGKIMNVLNPQMNEKAFGIK